MKEINKDLLSQLHLKNQSGGSSIHTLYQDLYVCDLKKDIADVEGELKFNREMYSES